jgi:hypothetical protein
MRRIEMHRLTSHAGYTGGYNVIDVQVIQTLICCPPLPEVDWILHNPDSSLLASDLLLNGGEWMLLLSAPAPADQRAAANCVAFPRTPTRL